MVRHAKNNTNASSFTYAERQMLKDGSKRERLGRDAMKNFNACSLCLQVARDPKTCDEGHLYCHECILSALVAQKKDMQRQQAILESIRREAQVEMKNAREAARQRVVDEFESSQNGLGSGLIDGKAKRRTGRANAELGKAGEKRNAGAFELDENEVEKLAEEATVEALNRTARELAEQSKAKLPNFWLVSVLSVAFAAKEVFGANLFPSVTALQPSLTPSATPDSVLDVKLQTLCHATKPPHPVSLKTLTNVQFAVDASDSAKGVACICPVCRKSLTNNVKAYVVRSCGHVVCGTCMETLCIPDRQCAHCGTSTTPSEKKKKAGPAFIELRREGTGFAAGGQAEATKYDLPFQG
ncbi:BQ5605_C024g09826 [Microbotryum silenes-dioicae]|uniref:BQ5605_C024g09826 protein n=1 Tax=Microbotryum silenes-dioicae TaxID=796604 RepID=A0A2X0PFD6_9BASI|nr:BQ5605_C024g09826 [Microbotryum silenes-dioicae]